ncbi:MAG TPA: membrane protein insertion efficiency factor YidD [Bacteroidia bacterium]|nr:membrane protein insertion efficiency factor YidD [Bacteroidia bacterium]
MQRLSLIISTFIILSSSLQSFSQGQTEELYLIGTKDYRVPKYEKRTVTFLASKSESAVVKYNPVTLTFGSLLYVYQRILSPQVSAECRFHMSCSAFSKAAIQDFGLIKGIALTSDRIMKCNRLAAADARPGDFDDFFKIYDTPAKYRIVP